MERRVSQCFSKTSILRYRIVLYYVQVSVHRCIRCLDIVDLYTRFFVVNYIFMVIVLFFVLSVKMMSKTQFSLVHVMYLDKNRYFDVKYSILKY